jgi:two-component system response regulator AtoC
MPPLRDRKDDIVPLAQHFLRRFCQEHRKPAMSLSPEGEAALLMHPWRGNVRELENLISRAVVLSPHSVLKPSDLGFAFDGIPTEVNLKFAKAEIDFVRKP